jgi:Protein of unknown function (DUF1559)
VNQETPNRVEGWQRRLTLGRLLVVIFVAGLIILILPSGGVIWPVQAFWSLAVGWGYFLVRVIPRVTVNAIGLVTGVVAVVLFGVGLHLLLGWIYRATHPTVAEVRPRQWRARWTGGLAMLVVLTFAAGIAAVGVAHQIGWLVTAPAPLTQGGMSDVAGRVKSQNNLRMIALAALNHESAHRRLPPGYTVDEWGRPLHGWQTQLLPYLERDDLYGRLRLDKPWDDPQNSVVFRSPVREFSSPYFGEQYDPVGYNLSHYAGNSEVFRDGRGKPLGLSAFKDGVSNTVIFGEVSAGFRPWGHPLNVRDPGRGIRASADAFAGPWSTGLTYFANADGSVRAVRSTASPAALRALATPAGWDHVPEADRHNADIP